MKPVSYRGQIFSIDHLAPQVITCPCTGLDRELIILVSFANHCYTRSFDVNIHAKNDILLYDSPNRARVFCPTRHKLSFLLPKIVTDFPSKRVHQTTSKRNYVFSARIHDGRVTYNAFFMLQRAPKTEAADLRMTIESAYPEDRIDVSGSVRFTLLAHHTYVGKSIRFAPR